MTPSTWTVADRRQLRSRGISAQEALRQLSLLRHGAQSAVLRRPCTLGDGVLQLAPERQEVLTARQLQAVSAGRFERFVPASGAASRMFRPLTQFFSGSGQDLAWPSIEASATSGDSASIAMVQTLLGATQLPFAKDLDTLLQPAGGLARTVAARDHHALLSAMLGDSGLRCGERPKGLLPFHRYPDGGARTPVEEHLAEAAAYASSATGACRCHFTVSREHLQGFEDLLRHRREALERECGSSFHVTFSTQSRSTDTLSIDLDGEPARDPAGRLLFRPGGHGSLLANLSDLGAEFVYIKNIDNIQPLWQRQPTSHWKRVLGGLLVEVQDDLHRLVRRLRTCDAESATVGEARRTCSALLGIPQADLAPGRGLDLRQMLLHRLDRPLRICGVVRNTGEPGGGPFWVAGRDGLPSTQIVEASQVDLLQDEQRQIFKDATHFNPVDLVCGLRDADGRAFDLHRFVDPAAVLVTRKSALGRDVMALERPGLWNGGMAEWITLFVEVPLSTFTPVKSIVDLLRPEHQPA